MSNIFDNNQLQEIRFQSGDIILYEPTIEDRIRLKEIVSKSVALQENGEVKGDVDIKFIREIIRNLTKGGNFVDEMTDKEIQEKLEKGNRRLILLYNEIEDLLYEISEDVLRDNIQQIKTVNSMVNIMNSNIDANAIKNKLEKLFKRKKINISVDELIKNQGDSVALEKLIQQGTMPVNAKINR